MQGLPVPSAIAANTNDATSRQIWGLLRLVGRRLCKPTNTHRWQVLTRLWELDTTPTETLYVLPEDFDSFEDLTGWNYTSRLPMLGPATDPQWQTLKARNLGSSTISVVYRNTGGKFEIYNTFPDPQALRINYTSRAWVALTSSPDPLNPVYADAPTEDGDMVLFDPELMVTAVQLAFMTAKGFDTTSIATVYQKMLEAAICADSDAPVLQTVIADTYPLLTTQFNVPDTGYGV